jgi:hypothetical protein
MMFKKSSKKIFALSKSYFNGDIWYLHFFSVWCLNFNLRLACCSLNKSKHLHKKIILLTPFSWLLENCFSFFFFVDAHSMAEITPYFEINMTNLSQFLEQKMFSSHFLLFIVFNINIAIFYIKFCCKITFEAF